MCGIVGLIARKLNGFFASEAELLENLLVTDTIRGRDSTGAYCISGNKQVTAIKIASNPFNLFATDEWQKFRQKVVTSGRIVVGHNRKATQGSISSENAHPFIENHIILVHNGTLYGHRQIADREVDSHAVCAAFAEKGAEEVLPTIDGAFAFIWWDTKKERLYAVRNTERPLALVVTEDLFAIASEPWMPTALLAREGKKVLETIPIEPGKLYEFGLHGTYNVKDVQLKKKEPVTNTGTHGTPATNMTGTGGADNCLIACDQPNMSEWEQMVTRNRAKLPHSSTPAASAPNVQQNRSAIMTLGATHPDYKKNDEVLLNIDSFRVERDARIKALGKIVSPGKEQIDFVGYMPTYLDIDGCENWQGEKVSGKVAHLTRSNCGLSAWVTDLKLEHMVKTNNEDISTLEWKYICANERCVHCEAKILEGEQSYTTVTTKGDGKFRVTCGDCVEDRLPEGEIKNEFVQRRAATVQARQSVSKKLDDSVNYILGKESTPTVH